MTPTNPELRKFIVQFFSDEGLETLCFDYFPEAINEFGGGMSKNRKVIILISHCEHRSRLADLHAAVARERPEAWNRQFTAADVQKPGFSEESRFPDERDPRQIFLSHATVDAGFAHTLAADLRAEGWKVWIAPDSIRPGEKWLEAINRGLETSGIFLVVLSPDAVASRWVRTETNAAISMEHRDLMRLFPLDVVECEPPWLWTQYQYLPFRGSYEAGLDGLLRRLDNDRESVPPASPPVTNTPSQTKKPPPDERKISDKQAKEIQALAHEIAAELGRQSGDDELREVYRRFNRHFGLGGYKQLPRRRFAEGLEFLKSWRESISIPAPYEADPPISNLPKHENQGGGTSYRQVSPEEFEKMFGRDTGEGGFSDFFESLFGDQRGSYSHVRPQARIDSPHESADTLFGSNNLRPPWQLNNLLHEKTRIELIHIPAGRFYYGDGKRVIYLPEYWIARYPVTNAQFERFVRATNYRTTAEEKGFGYVWTGKKWDDVKGADWRHPGGPKTSIDGKDTHPMVQVSWHDVQAFCDWAGLALPTEEEWEKAARGTDGRVYPWGDDWADGRCNTWEAEAGGTTAVGHYSPQGDSPYGCADMAGNVWEWTATATTAGDAARRVVRGGSWNNNRNVARAAWRDYDHPVNRGNDLGCRLVRRPPSQAL